MLCIWIQMVEEVEEEGDEISFSVLYSFDHIVFYAHKIFLNKLSKILIYNITVHWAVFNFSSMEYFD